MHPGVESVDSLFYWKGRVGAVAGLSLLVAAPAMAQNEKETTAIEVGELFTWAQNTPPNWGEGAPLAALGLVGALFTTSP